MSKELALVQADREPLVFDDKRKELIRKTVARELNPLEFEFFISAAQTRGLDPILGQIHAVKRGGRVVLQVAIDGGRVIANRSGEYAGSDAPVFTRDEDNLLVATVTVHRMVQGQRVPFVGIAYWSEFYPGDPQGHMWKKMPKTMLAKCAEMQALRKGFPNDLSDLYAPEELQRDVESAEETTAPAALAAPDDKRAQLVADLLAKFRKIGVSETMICGRYAIDDAAAINEEQYRELNQIGQSIVVEKKSVGEFFPAPEGW